LVSGFFFAVAAMAKPTAMLDLAIFGVFASGLLANLVLALGVALVVL